MNDLAPSEIKVQRLFKRFWDSYRELRTEWMKTGGGMDMEIKVRDASAEREFTRRSKAAKEGATKRRTYG